MFGSPHDDVLQVAVNDDNRERLLEEIKNRGRASVAGKDWKSALKLYQRAIEVSPEEATLYSNLSLVYFSMGSWKESKEAAEDAISKDVKSIKGYWRLTQAHVKMQCFQEALQTVQKGLVYEPTNKAFLKEVQKLKTKIQEQQQKEKATKTTTTEQQQTSSSNSAKSTTSSQSTTSASKPPPPKKSSVEKVEDEPEFTKSDHVKGYKIVNGKKTSYFHNELDEKTKQLIGDIAPKRLDAAAAAPAAPTSSVDSTSVWNKAGTWEERDVSVWAKQSLEKSLLNVAYMMPDDSASIVVSKVPTCDGHASVATVRGKKRLIYEFLIEIEWEWSGSTGEEAKGSMKFPDIDGTCPLGEPYDVSEFKVKECSSSHVRPILDQSVRRGAFRNALDKAIDDWVRLFQETF